MKNNNLKEIFTAFVLITLALTLLNPFHLWMPDMMHMTLLALAIVIFGFFASFILQEKPQDERDEVNQTLSGRIGFLVGAGIMILGIVVQAFADVVDPWLVTAFSIMVITKMSVRYWSDKNH